MQADVIEKRRFLRHVIDWPVCLWFIDAQKFVLGISRNISKSGCFIEINVVCEAMLSGCLSIMDGQEVELNYPRSRKFAAEIGQHGRLKVAKVVRIDRTQISENKIGIAMSWQ